MTDRGTAKVAKKLDIDCAEAIVLLPFLSIANDETGFEFKKQRAIPVVEGIVVAAENGEIVLDAWREEEEIRFEKEAAKKEKEILARWKRFLVGLRIRQRINQVYGTAATEEVNGS
jgi:xeroderma pigmentosum group C-complementing protein